MLKIHIVHFRRFKNIKILINKVNALTSYYNLNGFSKSVLFTARIFLPYLIIFSRCG